MQLKKIRKEYAMEPLAKRMRPHTIDEVIGQSHILSPDSLLVRMIKNDKLSSIILYGPPGTGKTTIANVIANTTHADFQQVNAVSGGKKDLETICKNAKKRLEILNKSNDGFKIAEEDLKLRGPGDFFGIRQSGEMDFVLADIIQDADILKMAAEVAPYLEEKVTLSTGMVL